MAWTLPLLGTPSLALRSCLPVAAPWLTPKHVTPPAHPSLPGAVLERSTLGVPHSALPLLASALLLVALAAGAVPWWSDAAVPRLLAWLGGSTAVAAGAAGVSLPPGGSRGRRAAMRAAVR